MDENDKLDSVDFSSVDNVLNYINGKVDKIQKGAPYEEIKNIVIQVFNINKEKKKSFRAFQFEKKEIPENISPFVQFIKESCENSNNLSTITEAFVTHKQLINDFYRQCKNESVQNLILRIMAIILKSEIKENQNTNKLNQSESNEAAPNALDEEIEKKPVTFEQLVRSDLKKVLKEIKILTNPDSTDPDSTDSGSSELTINGLIIPGIGILVLVFALLLLLFYEVYNSNRSAFNKFENLTKQLNDMYTPPTGNDKDSGYLKTQFEKLSKPDSPPPKKLDPKGPVISASKNDTSDLDTIASKLQTDLITLNTKIIELNAFKVPDLSKKIENKLSDEQIKKVFDSVVKDETSDFGLAMKKIKDLGNKGAGKTDDTDSVKDKGNIVILKNEKDVLQKTISGLEKDLKDGKKSVDKLTDDVTLKSKSIKDLEAKIVSINNEKVGFKGPAGHFAILLTNSKDFELTEPILSATLVTVEKQIKECNGTQKLGIYTATGNSIDIKFNLKKGTRGLKPTEMDVANARPTESIAEVGKTFLEWSFDDGKDPNIPVNDRKAIIIATWSAGAPKDVDGWDKISQVDVILIQTPKANQLREGSAWLDFILKKNGRLLFVQAEEKITGSSPAIVQLQKHLSTLLNTKKD